MASANVTNGDSFIQVYLLRRRLFKPFAALTYFILAKWLAELNQGLQIPAFKAEMPDSTSGISSCDFDDYCVAKGKDTRSLCVENERRKSLI